jgi:hypothetical protein
MTGNWRKARRSNSQGQCVEAASWRKPGGSVHNGACVEAGQGPGVIGVRDSRDRRVVLEVSPEAWARFTRSLKIANSLRE